MQQKAPQYFPGHMAKSLRKISSYLKVIDLVVILLDARAPLSSKNPLLENEIKNKTRLFLLTKSDWADPAVTGSWLDYFKKQGEKAISGNLKKDKILDLLAAASEELLAKKREKEKRVGMKPQPIKAMVIGIPNVGKSTFINNLRGKKIAAVGNKAGVTRAEQWIKLSEDFVLLDTPGILPMNYPDGAQAVRLALLGSMKEEVLPTEELSYALIGYLRENYPDALNPRFGIDDLRKYQSDDVLLSIAQKRLLLEGSRPSLTKAAYLLIKEFKDGILGRFTLEIPPDAE